jgi:hypothetical protein
LFKALVGAYKRFSIKDHILSITTDNYIVNNSIVKRFKKHVIKSTKNSSYHKLPLAVFKVANSYICCIVYLINLLAQAILTSLRSIAKKHTNVLYDNTKFISKASYAFAIGKTCCIIVKYRCLNFIKAALAYQCTAFWLKSKCLFLDIEIC